MVNFDDMTLEELQKLLSVNTKNPDEVKRIQEISGLTGKSIDGIWGKQTSKAWNNFLDKNQSDIEQAISDEQKYQNAIARGQNSPAVVDLVGFSNQLDEQQQARDAKIAQLEQQIAQVEERIARNKRALTGKSYEDVNNKLAQLEMDKIGFRFNGQAKNNDPTSFWRWNQARVDTKEANDLRKAEAKNKFGNEISKWENRQFDPNMTSMEVRQEIKNIENAIQEGKNIGADVSRLEKVRQSLLDRFSDKGTTAVEDKTGEYETYLVEVQNGLHTSEEIDNYAEAHKYDLTYAQYNKLRDAAIKTGKKENDKAKATLEAKAKALFKKERPDGNWDRLLPEKKEEYRNRVRGK